MYIQYGNLRLQQNDKVGGIISFNKVTGYKWL